MKHIRALLLLLLFIVSPAVCDAQANHPIKNEYVRLGNVDSMYTTKEQILSNPQLISLNGDCTVTGFTVFWYPRGGEWSSIKASGSKFTIDQIALIKRVKMLDYFCFEDIKLQCQQNIVYAPTIILKIK